MKFKNKIHTVGTIPKFNRKVKETMTKTIDWLKVLLWAKQATEQKPEKNSDIQ